MTRLTLRSLRPGDSGKRRALLGLLILGLISIWSVPALRPQAAKKNRVIISEGNKLKAFEFNPVTSKFDQVWESANTGIAEKMGGIKAPVLTDLDRDGKNELIAIDPMGIMIFGKTGKYPQYYNFDSSMFGRSDSQILPIDIDGDSVVEFITQGLWQDYGSQRLITIWKPSQNRLHKLSEIPLQGDISWSLAYADCDNDNISELLSASTLISIMKWDASKGLTVQASFANASSLVDVIRVADANNDGRNEIVASGNSGAFSIHTARSLNGVTYYPVAYQSEQFGGEGPSAAYTQGLLVTDIDGDGKNEVLVGLTGKQVENILVFEIERGSNPSRMRFRKIFGMPHDSSQILGFVAGDVDNDGKTEVIYNSKYVLKFSRDASDNLKCQVLAKITDYGIGAVVGTFEPTGADTVPGPRAILGRINVELPEDGHVFSGGKYKCWLNVTGVWADFKNVQITLESENKEIKIEKKAFRIDSIKQGQVLDNKEQPFVIRAEKVDNPTRINLRARLTAEGGFQVTRTVSGFLRVFPELTFNSDTLAVSDPNIYKDLSFSYDFFNDNGGTAWPPKDAILRHKNYIVLDELSNTVEMRDYLQPFLDKGGNYFVHGYGVIRGYDGPTFQAERDFVAKYLHATCSKDYVGERKLTGAKGDLIGDGFSIELQRNRYNMQSAVLEPLEGAIPIFYYPNGNVAGIRIDGKYKLVYLEFALQDIKSLETRRELIRRVLAWFNGK
jgi:hypothetical protein